MVNTQRILQQDLKHIWHPCTQMKDFETFPPLVAHRAEGSYIYTNEGRIIDAISSWWCKSLGHGHPFIKKAISQQLEQFEHIIATQFTHNNLAELGVALAEITKKQHLFFASDGASAVEIALKLTIHANQIRGFKEKKQFLALKNGYHGETMATMAISDLGIYKQPYQDYALIPCHYLQDIPYCANNEDPLWVDAATQWAATEIVLEPIKHTLSALVLEPIIQGAGGMRCYSADFLSRLANWAQSNDIYVIADEIMTGMGRTGLWLASEHAKINPDLICLSKGLTSGTIPFSCVMIDQSIFDLFYDDYGSGKSFLHSHTYSGHSLAVTAALATIRTFAEENILEHVQTMGKIMHQHMQDIAALSGKLSNIRGLGGVIAADLEKIPKRRIGFDFAQQALKKGALIRPIGNTLYWLPPLNTDLDTIGKLAEITLNSIKATYV